jgi:nucleolar protein 16
MLIVIELLEMASKPSIPNSRHTTQVEGEWIKALVDAYGDDYESMAWDLKLNPMQQTAGQLRRKVKIWERTAKRS